MTGRRANSNGVLPRGAQWIGPILVAIVVGFAGWWLIASVLDLQDTAAEGRANRAILTQDVEALREQLIDLGEVPVAPPPEEIPQGERGLTGPMGPMGPIGPPGLRGELGPTGPMGEQGLPGEVGPAGPAGERGETGAEGTTGQSGPAGPQGESGPAGPAGVGIATVVIDDDCHLIVTLTNDAIIDAGEVCSLTPPFGEGNEP